jgi:hypothetical protein
LRGCEWQLSGLGVQGGTSHMPLCGTGGFRKTCELCREPCRELCRERDWQSAVRLDIFDLRLIGQVGPIGLIRLIGLITDD